MAQRIQDRRGTAAAWTTANPILAAGESGYETDTGKWKYGDGTTAWTALGYQAGSEVALSAANGPIVTRQQSGPTTLLNVIPQTAGHARFVIRANRYENMNAQAGTYNHTVHMGFNAGRHAGGDVDAGISGWYAGFEDNYYNYDGDQTIGPEFYISYVTPDGTTLKLGDLRPFYIRLQNAPTNNNTDKNVEVNFNLGAGSGGYFSVGGASLGVGVGDLFSVTKGLASFSVPTDFKGGTVRVVPTTGQALLSLVSSIAPTISMRNDNLPAWALQSVSATVFKLFDKDSNAHATFTYGAAATTRETRFDSTLVVAGDTTVNSSLSLTGTALNYVRSSGQALVVIDSPIAPVQRWRVSGANAWAWQAGSVNGLTLFDKSDRANLVFTYGATAAAAILDVGASLKVQGNVGFYNTTPVAKPTVSGSRGGNAALASLLTALASQGLLTDSSTA